MSSGHSNIPIYREDLDRIEGFAHSMDILRFLSDANGTRSINLEQCLRPVIFIPESKTLEDLLTEFQEKRKQMSIVIDEYGGVSGLVTVEDLVEEIVGELHDEFDRGESEIRKISDTEYYMDAGIDIDDITQTIGIPFEGEGFDTIGGFVLHQLGKIPSPGDEFSYNGLNIQVISTLGRRLKSLKITPTAMTVMMTAITPRVRINVDIALSSGALVHYSPKLLKLRSSLMGKAAIWLSDNEECGDILGHRKIIPLLLAQDV